ncbi:SAGA-associated factor 29 [Sergentomyia squamirostris]
MPLTAETATIQVQERLKSIQFIIHELENERRRNEVNINNILKAQGKMTTDEKSMVYQHKLKSLYKVAISECVTEENLIRQALAKIHEIRAIRSERRMEARNAGNKETIRRGAQMVMLDILAQTLPLFVSKPGEKAPALCGAIPAESSYIAKPGDTVAALVKGREQENWIIAEVVQFLSSQKYEVDDIDEEQKDRHVVSKRRIVPLPIMRANPETDAYALFPEDSTVMALYPQTTCFYKAIVVKPPQTASEGYELIFEDPNYPEGYSPPMKVAQRYVISIKQNKKFTSGV